MSGINWRDFKTDPPYDPYDPYEDEQNGLETDVVCAWFVFRYTNRPAGMENGPCLSDGACYYRNGVFSGYEHHIKTSPFPSDRIEIVAWTETDPVAAMILDTFKNATT
jgi:hypothetical protein